MAYTISQQSRIDAATAKVDSTKNTYDAAAGKLTTLETTARGFKDSVFQCLGFSNSSNKDFRPLSTNNCETCALNYKCPQCKTKAECQRRVREFNSAYDSWNSYRSTVDNLKTAYDSAKDELKGVLDTIAIESNNDPEVIISNNQIKAQQDISKFILKSKNVQIAIFAVIALIIVGVMIAVLRK